MQEKSPFTKCLYLTRGLIWGILNILIFIASLINIALIDYYHFVPDIPWSVLEALFCFITILYVITDSYLFFIKHSLLGNKNVFTALVACINLGMMIYTLIQAIKFGFDEKRWNVVPVHIVQIISHGAIVVFVILGMIFKWRLSVWDIVTFRKSTTTTSTTTISSIPVGDII